MSKKIVVIHGSPRKQGNTRAVSSAAINAAKNKDADVTEIRATEVSYTVPGCQSCLQCHLSTDYRCMLDDQLSTMVASLIDYDVIMIATPTYWMSYPAQLKIFIDRIGSLMKFTDKGEVKTPLEGKQLALLATAGGGLANNLDLLEQQWRSLAKILSCSFQSCLFPDLSAKPGTMENDVALIQKAHDFGELLSST